MVENILNKQRAFFRSGRTLSVSYRKNALKKLREAILKNSGRICDALQTDLGKSRTESYMCETGMVLSELDHAVRHIRSYSGRRKVRTPLAQFPARSYIIPEPYGNVLVMSPWNYPLLLSLAPVISAVAAGNTVILKPSAYSPETSAVVSAIVREAFPEEHVATVEGGRDVNSDLLEQKFDYIFFTGSKSVGRLVMSKASVHLTPVTLELGGKSPVIVDRSLVTRSGNDKDRKSGRSGYFRDTGLRTAARRIVFGKFLNCGQTCVAPDYVLVHEDVADDFLEACKEETARMFGEHPLDNRDYGKIVNGKHFDRLCRVISELAGHGPELDSHKHETESSAPVSASSGGNSCRIILGGKSEPENLRIEPTIARLGNVTDSRLDSLEVMQDEIFGPVLPVLTYRDIEDIIGYIDERPRPLAAYIFTADNDFKETLLGRLHFGGGCINDTVIHLATEEMPFGGVGESGMGRYHGKYGFETFSHLKSIVDKPLWLDLPMRYQPYTKVKEKLVRMFLK